MKPKLVWLIGTGLAITLGVIAVQARPSRYPFLDRFEVRDTDEYTGVVQMSVMADANEVLKEARKLIRADRIKVFPSVRGQADRLSIDIDGLSLSSNLNEFYDRPPRFEPGRCRVWFKLEESLLQKSVSWFREKIDPDYKEQRELRRMLWSIE